MKFDSHKNRLRYLSKQTIFTPMEQKQLVRGVPLIPPAD